MITEKKLGITYLRMNQLILDKNISVRIELIGLFPINFKIWINFSHQKGQFFFTFEKLWVEPDTFPWPLL